MSIMMSTQDQSEVTTGTAHAKLILAGEHAVVYGQPALVVPVKKLRTVSTVERISGASRIDCELYSGPVATLPNELRGLGDCISQTMESLGHNLEGHLVRITSTIPPGRGLGSSAAVAVAVVRSLYAYYGRKLDKGTLTQLANIEERYAHGTPSGIDLEAVTSDTPLWFQKGHPTQWLHVSGKFHFVIADSGRIGDTRSAVGAVRTARESNSARLQEHMNRIGQIAHEARDALLMNHPRALGVALNTAHAELEQIGVSDAGLNNLVNAALSADALGAKLTGGGRGGCILALASTRDHAEEMASALCGAGASQCWELTVGDEGSN